MRAGAFLLALAWFSGSVFAGYRLTERSFAWIGEAPPTSVPGAGAETPAPTVEELKAMTPERLKEEAKKLSPQQMLCLGAAISPDRVSAVLSGDITPQEAEAARACLE